MKTKFLFVAVFLAVYSLCIAQAGFVYRGDKSKLFRVDSNQIFSSDGDELLYFQKGNIFFTARNDSKDNIFLMASSMNIYSNRTESIYEKNQREPIYNFSKGKLYTVENDPDRIQEPIELLHIEQVNKWIAFYSTLSDSLLAYYKSDSLPVSTAVIVAYTLAKAIALVKKGAPQSQVLSTQREFSSIKPVWGNTSANEWIWDGKILRPRWNPDTRFIWSFDGQTVKPLYGTNIYDQYSWDGEIFKPIWRTNRNQEWSWDGKRLQPVYSTDWANQYNIEDGIVKPWSNVHTEREWRIDGEIPIPIIILVLSGLASLP